MAGSEAQRVTAVSTPPLAPARRPPPAALLYSSLVVMVLFWSLNYVVSKVALRHFPPLLLAGLRTMIAGAVMVPVYAFAATRDPKHQPLRLADLPVLCALGVFGVAMNQFFFVVGVNLTSVGHTGIINGLGPILVLLIAAGVRQERITVGKAIGMAIALGGLAILERGRAGSAATFTGDALVFIGSAAFAVFAVFGKSVTGRYGAVTVNAVAYFSGAILLTPLTVWQWRGFSLDSPGWAGWLSILYMAVFSSIICYLIFYWALRHIPASRVSAFQYLQPLFAAVLAFALLGEPITTALAGGGALVLAGVFVTERS